MLASHRTYCILEDEHLHALSSHGPASDMMLVELFPEPEMSMLLVQLISQKPP